MAWDIKYINRSEFSSSTAWALCVLIIALLPGCRKSGFFEKAGDVKRVIVPIESFDEIILNDKINLILIYDSVNEVSVEAGENLIDGIELDVADRKLTLSDRTKFRWTRDLDYTVNVYVRSKTVKRVVYYGAGNISSQNEWKGRSFQIDSWTGIGSINMRLDCDSTQFVIRMGSADINISGRTNYSLVYCADHGSVNLEHLAARQMTLSYRSIRNSAISVIESLKADILYKGSVYYKGNPTVELFLDNTGRLIKVP